jgi:hypothetical protein
MRALLVSPARRDPPMGDPVHDLRIDGAAGLG